MTSSAGVGNKNKIAYASSSSSISETSKPDSSSLASTMNNTSTEKTITEYYNSPYIYTEKTGWVLKSEEELELILDPLLSDKIKRLERVLVENMMFKKEKETLQGELSRLTKSVVDKESNIITLQRELKNTKQEIVLRDSTLNTLQEKESEVSNIISKKEDKIDRAKEDVKQLLEKNDHLTTKV